MTKCKRLSNKCAAWGIAIAHFESFNLEQIKFCLKPLENDKFTFKFNPGTFFKSPKIFVIRFLSFEDMGRKRETNTKYKCKYILRNTNLGSRETQKHTIKKLVDSENV